MFNHISNIIFMTNINNKMAPSLIDIIDYTQKHPDQFKNLELTVLNEYLNESKKSYTNV